MDWKEIYKDIEERLLPYYQCDIWERGLYYYLLSQSRLHGLESATIPLSQVSCALRSSASRSRKTIRSLADKGCIELEQTRLGHFVKVFLPSDLPLPEQSTEKASIDIETVDFYKNREYLPVLLKRERGQCFYCLREIKEDSCELDHVESLLIGGNNNFRNIVASCHRCNTKKQGGSAEDYIRQLFRKSLLNEKEFESRLLALEALRDGQLKPDLK
ncbi:MAG: HNH endonuclease [Chlorobium sp.]|nr:HNH endonuclease [Chlorobium sp.]